MRRIRAVRLWHLSEDSFVLPSHRTLQETRCSKALHEKSPSWGRCVLPPTDLKTGAVSFEALAAFFSAISRKPRRRASRSIASRGETGRSRRSRCSCDGESSCKHFLPGKQFCDPLVAALKVLPKGARRLTRTPLGRNQPTETFVPRRPPAPTLSAECLFNLQ